MSKCLCLYVLNFFSDDHWLGLAKIWALTKSKQQKSTLRIELWDFEGGSVNANYQNFHVGNEKTAYKLHVGKYSGTAGIVSKIYISGQQSCSWRSKSLRNLAPAIKMST